MAVTYHVGILRGSVADIIDDETFIATTADDLPVYENWLHITVADEAAFDQWMAARRDYEVHNHRPYGNFSREDEQEIRDEYAKACAEAEATMRALEITEDATSATSG